MVARPSRCGLVGWLARNPVLAFLWIGGAAIVAYLMARLLVTTGGLIVYSIDDTYIALALSERIARGQYGINPGEWAAVSSSVLYPFLLVPAAGTDFHVALPLVLNVAGAAISLWAIARTMELSNAADALMARLLAAALALTCGFAINLFGVIFVGLEHSLHVAASLAILAGLITVVERGKVPIWLLAAIVLTPLLRFEGIVAASAALLVLFGLGAWRQALATAAVLAGCLAGYFYTMHLLDLPLLPASVTLKARLARAAASTDIGGMFSAILTRFSRVGAVQPARVLAVIGGLALAPSLILAVTAPRNFRFRDAAIPIYVAGVTFGHVAGGGYGWFERYDVYALAVGLAGLFYIYRRWWRWILGRMARPAEHPAGRLAGSVGFLAAILCLAGAVAMIVTQNKAHWRASLISHAAAYNIYEQQGQMSRFVREVYRGPVVVNDLGYVAWRNPYYVLDLVGLGSEEVRRMRNAGVPPAQMLTELAARHEVGLAIVYADMLPPGIEWVPMAYLRLGTRRITPGRDTVVFLRTRQGSAERIDHALREFEKVLPPGVVLDRSPE